MLLTLTKILVRPQTSRRLLRMQRSQKIIEPGKEDSSGENSDDTFVADPDREFLHYNELLARLD